MRTRTLGARCRRVTALIVPLSIETSQNPFLDSKERLIMERARTVVETKETFLRQQIRLLTAILEPSEDWRQYGAESQQGDLSEKAVDDALHKRV